MWRVKWLVLSYDLIATLAAFIGGASLYAGDTALGTRAVPVFLASSAIGLGTLGTTFAGMALFAGVLEDERYRRTVEGLPHGIAGAIWPFRVIAFVALVAASVGLAVAVVWTPGYTGVEADLIFASPPALAVWCVVGTWQLFTMTALHAEARHEVAQSPSASPSDHEERTSRITAGVGT